MKYRRIEYLEIQETSPKDLDPDYVMDSAELMIEEASYDRNGVGTFRGWARQGFSRAPYAVSFRVITRWERLADDFDI